MYRPIRIVGLQPQDSDSHQSKKKSAHIDSNGVEGIGDGIAGVAACDGADRLQAEQCSLTARMSFVIPGQNTIDLARDSMDDTP